MIDEHERIRALKERRRQQDIAGMPGQAIARRNAWVSPEAARKARIVFA